MSFLKSTCGICKFLLQYFHGILPTGLLKACWETNIVKGLVSFLLL
jgi:hypothetical protein